MNPALRITLKRLIRIGSLRIADASGSWHEFGDGSGEPVAVRFADRLLEWQLLIDPHLVLGEAFMDGRLTVERGSIYKFLYLSCSNIEQPGSPGWLHYMYWLRYLTRRFQQFNPLSRAKRNVAHHYDLDSGLYDLFLDEDKQYSCAYFETPDATLEQAQIAKKRHIAAKMDLQPGQRVLDIGSGWGGMALTLAETHDVRVTGITLSEHQHAISCERAARRGLSRAVEFRLQDYRLLDEHFNRIVSVGMFEHVGIVHYDKFFQLIRDLLTDDGVALLHTIGRYDPPAVTNPWIAKYIFPGGYIPSLSEILPSIERARLYVTDIEVLRLHYAETLRIWRERFLANRDQAAKLYDERFCRMWEFYLAVSEAGFRTQDLEVFQIQLAKKKENLPITRDYMFGREHEYRESEQRVARANRPAE